MARPMVPMLRPWEPSCQHARARAADAGAGPLVLPAARHTRFLPVVEPIFSAVASARLAGWRCRFPGVSGVVISEWERGREDPGPLALMELQASRAATRTDSEGNLVLLADQDRSRWDQVGIARGLACLDRAGPLQRAGPYQLQAAIAACHARAPSWEATDWPRIVVLYGALAEAAPSPVVELNRAVAIGLAQGPEAGLVALDRMDASALADYHLFPAARADFLRRLER